MRLMVYIDLGAHALGGEANDSDSLPQWKGELTSQITILIIDPITRRALNKTK